MHDHLTKQLGYKYYRSFDNYIVINLQMKLTLCFIDTESLLDMCSESIAAVNMSALNLSVNLNCKVYNLEQPK